MNNSSATIRHKLYDYIRIADSKKLHAIYNLLEGEIEQTNEWWKDKQLLKALEERYEALETSTDKGFTSSKLMDSVDKLRNRKYGR